MEKKPITSNLFRFVTLRSPQLADERKKDVLFVSYPEGKETESLAHRSVAGIQQETKRLEALQNAYQSPDFNAIENRLEVRKTYGKLYDFSNWLMRNKNYLSAVSIGENLQTILFSGSQSSDATPMVSDIILDETEEIVLWNNLFYQTIHKSSTSVREALIQLLITNRFLIAFNDFANSSVSSADSDGEIEFTEEQAKEFRFRANASVIVPKEVLYSPKSDVRSSSTKGMTTSQSAFLEKTVKVDLAKSRLKTYETALQEINKAELVYNKEEEKKYQAAIGVYEQQIKEIKSQPVIDTVIDPVTKEESQIETYPGLNDVAIGYIKSNEIIRYPEGVAAKPSESEAKITAQLSQETQALINTKDFELYDSFAEIKVGLTNKIKKEKEIILNNVSETSDVIIGGEVVSSRMASIGLDKSYVGYVDSDVNDLSTLRLTFYTLDSERVTVEDAQYAITNSDNDNVIFSGRSFQNLSISDNALLNVRLFTDNKIALSETTYKLNGELALSNGQILTFENERFITISRDEDGFLTSTGIEGQFTLRGEADTPDGSDSGSAEEGTIFGVSQLGIADFRRVEQEVCCYVPGEVSHIENIMAREYKEKSTRNLTSYESTTEESSEREAEVLTDTTSTERNELQSEASSIVNQDTASSFGANASVSGKIFGGSFSAGSNYNTSSSNSASNSNLQAQNYAQEVTERALERVVEKVSKKRTTRILKEFEENNTHGFDNRKGDQHVTGVYRWVDVIYKNKLVNYGKRLMYEFSIPEPAKYYIDSYIKGFKEVDKNENQLIVPRKPKHPNDFRITNLLGQGLFSPSDLTEDNYQRIAAEYNAEVKPLPKSEISVGESFSLSYNTAISTIESANFNGKVELPEGYRSVGATVGYTAVDNGDASRKGFYIMIGNKKVGVTATSQPLHEEGIVQPIDSYIDEVPVSGVLANYFQGALNVSVDCVRTDEYYQKWQNETFNSIMEAYYERVQEFNEFQQGQEVAPEEKEKQREFSSQLNRGIEKRELKRIAVDLMTAPFKDKFTVSQSHYGSDSKTVIKSEDLNNHASVVKFFEQAFDWEIMAYTFYPYFYKKQSDWADHFEYLDANDPIFKAFLQSGMARTVVPVRPGFEAAVNWFMNTGELWNGEGIVTDTEDDLYVSVAEEMLKPDGEVEGVWETRVPTALTILQADSVVLKEGGLPCNPDCNEHSLFESSTYKLGDGNSTSEPSPEGVDFDIVGETNTVQ
ncbi:hypothetical protein [uncultured Tenacibaculum sp.]|uniref:hypothetical protein n=1 Tax=uncultured Tenacibaculum sp. TaxID=174713 RepID=UPI00261DD69A|nr:hypothetical protein [uncultured Tenacibaculum sp.]